MEALFQAINNTPIIDHHAHNLLLPHELAARPLLSITTEAGAGALQHTKSTLAHMRAVKQLSRILVCKPDWDSIQVAIAKKNKEPESAWAKRCFEGIETVLIDDGLDAETVHPWDWHNSLTRSKCYRIVRIEKVAEQHLEEIIQERRKNGVSMGDIRADSTAIFREWTRAFNTSIRKAIVDPDVVGFKSVICYRTGLDIPGLEDVCEDSRAVDEAMARALANEHFTRLEDEDLSPYFVHICAALISSADGQIKPLQFHTGLGDNDITLTKSSPSHLQPFIECYKKLPIVLLHASYPYTKEAGYLASVYENVFLDIGEVFPMISQEGQENVIRESLELCPSEKLTWSTDGHWFPEIYLLAVLQIREGLKEVLRNIVLNGGLTIAQAIKVVEDILFTTSNKLYSLRLELKPLTGPSSSTSTASKDKLSDVHLLLRFFAENPSVKYLRLQWVDYTSTLRLRLLSKHQAISLFTSKKCLSVTKAALGLIQNDVMAEGTGPTGEYDLIPIFSSLRLGQRIGHATVQCEFRETDGNPAILCPRTTLRSVVERGQASGVNFTLGFEVEVVFVPYRIAEGRRIYDNPPFSTGHAWSTASSIRDPQRMSALEEIIEALETAKIEVLLMHPESAPGQYEFVLGPLPPLDAVDSLIAAREIIQAVGEKYSFRATLIPKPVPNAGGTGAHVHMSLKPEEKFPSFYAGILNCLRAICAFTLPADASYARMQASVWSGGRWVAWGTQNRETPLRKIKGSHWELKCMDGLANPYFAMAAILGSGLKGIRDSEQLTMQDCTTDPALLEPEERAQLGIVQEIPKCFAHALAALLGSADIHEAVPWEVINAYAQIKEAEVDMLECMDEEEERIFFLERY